MATTVKNGVIVSTPHYSSFSYRKKNRRQGDALTSASLLLMGNGLNYGLALFTFPFHSQLFQEMFFIGTLFGAMATSFLLHKFRKNVHYFLAGAFTLLSGILYLATEANIFSMIIPDGIIAANFFSGLSFGIVLLTSIIHSGGICVKHLRGFFLYQLQMSINVGIFILFLILRIVFTYPETSLNQYKSIGVTLIVMSVLSFITTFIFCIESPEFLYEINNNNEALVTIKRLRKENMDTLETLNDLDEIQNSVNDNNISSSNNNNNIISKNNIIVFIKIFMIRFAYILGTSIPINYLFMQILLLFLGIRTIFLNGILLIIVRIFSEIFGCVAVSIIGNKKPLIISLLFSGLLLIIINSIYISWDKNETSLLPSLGILILFYQIAIGFGLGDISLLAMSEGFTYHHKTYLNAAIIGLECIIQIIIISTFNISNDLFINENKFIAYIFITGFIQLIVCGLAMKFIPETSKKSLKESNELYSKTN